MYWWSRFDRAEIEGDFLRIRRANLDCVRIFLLWEAFQPSEATVDERSLGKLVGVADIAARHELSLIVTLFTGHMSGVNWIPAWALAPSADENARFRIVAGGRVVDARMRNWYADEGVVASHALLARSVAEALRDHPALWAYDLGNENSNCTLPPTHDAARRWLTQQAEAIRAADRRHPITIGLHMDDLERDTRLGPHDAATVCDFLSMHAYPMYARWARSATDAMVTPFLIQLTQWLGDADVLLEEFGAATQPAAQPQATSSPGLAASQSSPGLAAQSSPGLLRPGSPLALLSEADAARFVMEALAQARPVGAMGGLVWCYADYERSLWNKPPLDEAEHERHFGAWRADHTEKPVVGALRDAAEQSGAARPSETAASSSLDWIEMPRERFYDAPADNVRALYRTFLMRNQ